MFNFKKNRGYMVVTENWDLKDEACGRWCYGIYKTEQEAKEVASRAWGSECIFFTVIKAKDAEAYGVQNLPF